MDPSIRRPRGAPPKEPGKKKSLWMKARVTPHDMKRLLTLVDHVAGLRDERPTVATAIRYMLDKAFDEFEAPMPTVSLGETEAEMLLMLARKIRRPQQEVANDAIREYASRHGIVLSGMGDTDEWEIIDRDPSKLVMDDDAVPEQGDRRKTKRQRPGTRARAQRKPQKKPKTSKRGARSAGTASRRR